ncbi:MAG TPA: DMT family transporter [Acetobacteraceae bacterium]|nr:DMT family transporter [Acetobacteraceae bacterium]
MSAAVMAVVLLGAVLHATWNVAVRAGRDRRRETALLAAMAALLAAVLLPTQPWLRAAAWRHVAVSTVLHTFYFALMAEAYVRGGVALAYPLMRGVAPMLAMLAAWVLLGERLTPGGWAGSLAICAGVALLARRRVDAAERAAVLFALANAAVIAAYTVNDAVGARESGTPFGYALWVFLCSTPPTLIWLGRFGVLAWPTRTEALRSGGGAACSIAAYALTLWAMTRAHVAPVAALRETSMLFGIVLAYTVLGERPGARGWAAAGAIAAGAAVLRLA